jgi:hypothetical protein
MVHLADSGARFLPRSITLQRADDQARAEHEPRVFLPFVITFMYGLRHKRVPCFELRSRLLIPLLSRHSQPAGPFGRPFTVQVELAVTTMSLVRAAIAQLYPTPLANLVESLLRSVGSLDT